MTSNDAADMRIRGVTGVPLSTVGCSRLLDQVLTRFRLRLDAGFAETCGDSRSAHPHLVDQRSPLRIELIVAQSLRHEDRI